MNVKMCASPWFKPLLLHSHTPVFNMQHEPIPDKKRKIDTINHCINNTEVPETALADFMFLQIIGEYPFNYMVKIDADQDKIIYEDLLRFENSMITVEMNNHEPESLYALYEDNVARPERRVAWLEFFHTIATRKNPEKSPHFILNRTTSHEIQKARWFVSFSSR